MVNNESILAESFFAQGARAVAEKELAKTDDALKRGSLEVAAEHLKNSLDALKAYGNHLVSPRLTTEENIEWKRLRELDFGLMTTAQKEDLKLLNNKALGALDKFLRGETPLEFPSK